MLIGLLSREDFSTLQRQPSIYAKNVLKGEKDERKLVRISG